MIKWMVLAYSPGNIQQTWSSNSKTRLILRSNTSQGPTTYSITNYISKILIKIHKRENTGFGFCENPTLALLWCGLMDVNFYYLSELPSVVFYHAFTPRTPLAILKLFSLLSQAEQLVIFFLFQPDWEHHSPLFQEPHFRQKLTAHDLPGIILFYVLRLRVAPHKISF